MVLDLLRASSRGVLNTRMRMAYEMFQPKYTGSSTFYIGCKVCSNESFRLNNIIGN